jgi:hypothetical protein
MILETEVEGEIREFVRRDVASFRRQPESESEMVASKHQRRAAAGDRNLGAGDRKPHHGAADLARYAAK